jgi:hypothetical protein
LRETLEGHADGAVLVSWVDSWHYPHVSDTHEDEPWSWNGILAIPTDSKKDLDGIPRQVYKDVMAYNQVIPLDPKMNHLYKVGEQIPIRIYTSENIGGVDVSLNGGEWRPLRGSGNGNWLGFFNLPKTARRRQRLTVRGTDSIGQELARKEISFVTATSPEHVTIGLLETVKKTGTLQCRILVTDDKQKPIAHRKVYFGFFLPADWREAQGTQLTDARGEVLLTCPLPIQSSDRFLYVAAGTDNIDSIRTADMRIFKLSH